MTNQQLKLINTQLLNMTKRLKSKHKVDRRLKANIWGRPKVHLILELILQDNMVKIKKVNQLTMEFNYKQNKKLKAYYGNINERQFRNIYRKALI